MIDNLWNTQQQRQTGSFGKDMVLLEFQIFLIDDFV